MKKLSTVSIRYKYFFKSSHDHKFQIFATKSGGNLLTLSRLADLVSCFLLGSQELLDSSWRTSHLKGYRRRCKIIKIKSATDERANRRLNYYHMTEEEEKSAFGSRQFGRVTDRMYRVLGLKVYVTVLKSKMEKYFAITGKLAIFMWKVDWNSTESYANRPTLDE